MPTFGTVFRITAFTGDYLYICIPRVKIAAVASLKRAILKRFHRSKKKL
jgi:hypothetical protein